MLAHASLCTILIISKFAVATAAHVDTSTLVQPMTLGAGSVAAATVAPSGGMTTSAPSASVPDLYAPASIPEALPLALAGLVLLALAIWGRRRRPLSHR